jgi:hypothetical protein
LRRVIPPNQKRPSTCAWKCSQSETRPTWFGADRSRYFTLLPLRFQSKASMVNRRSRKFLASSGNLAQRRLLSPR